MKIPVGMFSSPQGYQNEEYTGTALVFHFAWEWSNDLKKRLHSHRNSKERFSGFILLNCFLDATLSKKHQHIQHVQPCFAQKQGEDKRSGE